MTGKQRAQLRALANKRPAMLQVGKEGITDGVLRQLDEMLENHELVKITVLESAMLTPREASQSFCDHLQAEAVQCIGSKLTLFRQAREPEHRTIKLVK